MAHPTQTLEEHEGLRGLVGRELPSVEFVRGYVQLRSDGPTLSAYTAPTIQRAGRAIVQGSPGYADSLVQAVGARVERAGLIGLEALRLEFEDGLSLEIPLVMRKTAEAASLTIDDTKIWTF